MVIFREWVGCVVRIRTLPYGGEELRAEASRIVDNATLFTHSAGSRMEFDSLNVTL